VPDFPGKI